MVLDLIIDKGEHHISIELLDSEDQIFESRALQTAVENKDNYIASLNFILWWESASRWYIFQTLRYILKIRIKLY